MSQWATVLTSICEDAALGINSMRLSDAYVSVNYAIIGSDNGLSPKRRQPIIWTNDGLLPIRPPGTYFNDILFKIQTFSFKKMHLKMLSAKMAAIFSRPQCVGVQWCRFLSHIYALDQH